jgi:hypothetical protein
MFNTRTARIAAIVATAGVVLFGANAAAASPSVPAYNGSQALPGNSVFHAQINDQVEADLMKTPANSVWTASLNRWSVTEDKLSPAVQKKLNAVGTGKQGPVGPKGDTGATGAQGPQGDPASDVLGKGKVMMSPAITIKTIGGPFLTGKTFLGPFTLQPGTWLVTSNATFNRTVAAQPTDTKTRPQLALRYDETEVNPFGDTAGTIMGVDISPTVGRELMGATVQTVYLPKATTVNVYAFGYNDDSSNFASGQITVAAQISATRIG